MQGFTPPAYYLSPLRGWACRGLLTPPPRGHPLKRGAGGSPKTRFALIRESNNPLCVIARNEAIRTNCFPKTCALDCFTAFAMTQSDTKFVVIRGASRKILASQFVTFV